MGKLELDFYYGKEAEQFTFYRLPKALITDERFKGISNNAKLLDYIGNQVVRIIVNVIIVAIFGLLEIGIFANATVPWLEGKEANKPRIRVER